MARIDASIQLFHQAVQQDKPIACSSSDRWHVEWRITAFLRRVFRLEMRRDTNVVKVFNQALDRLERVPVAVNTSGGRAYQAEDFGLYLRCAQDVFNRYCQRAAETQVHALAQRIVAFQYRIEGANGGLDAADVNQELLSELTARVAAWKAKHPHKEDNATHPLELKHLEQAACYPDFCRLLFHDPLLFNSFMKWSVRSGLSVDLFVQYPSVQKRITGVYLDKRLERAGGEGLKVLRQQTASDPSLSKKVVALRMDGEDVSLLDEEHTFTFRNEYTLTIKQILGIFQRKNYDVGNLEYLNDQGGVTNWHVTKLGYWNPRTEDYDRMDLFHEGFLERLPQLRAQTSTDLEARFGMTLKPGQHGIAAVASRTSPDLAALGCHAWLELYVPNADGTHQVYPIGKYATIFPEKWWEFLFAAGATFGGRLEYPEESFFRTNRQIAGKLWALSDEQFREARAIVQRDLIHARAGQLVFQLMGDNCASWVQSVLDRLFGEENAPRLYRCHFWDSHLQGPLGAVYNTICAIPFVRARQAVMGATLFVLGGFRKAPAFINDHWHVRHIYNSKHWQEQLCDNPALLVHRVKAGEVTSEAA